jgi:hypothetical protein
MERIMASGTWRVDNPNPGLRAQMPSASYYREQAKLLFQLSLTTSDPNLAAQYRLKGEEQLLLAREAAEGGPPLGAGPIQRARATEDVIVPLIEIKPQLDLYQRKLRQQSPLFAMRSGSVGASTVLVGF